MTTRFIKGGINISLTTVLAVASFVGVVVTPTLYVGGIKEANSNQDIRIGRIESDLIEVNDDNDVDIRLLQAAVSRIPYIEGKLDLLLRGEGWNPKEVKPAALATSSDITKL